MKKIDWSLTRAMILDACLIVFLGCGLYGGGLFIAAIHDKNDSALIIACVLLACTIVSLVIGCSVSIIDFICKDKKRKKQKHVQAKVIIREDVVV